MLLRTVTVLIALTFGVMAYAQVAPVSRPSVITPAQTITARNGMEIGRASCRERV